MVPRGRYGDVRNRLSADQLLTDFQRRILATSQSRALDSESPSFALGSTGAQSRRRNALSKPPVAFRNHLGKDLSVVGRGRPWNPQCLDLPRGDGFARGHGFSALS